MPTSDLLAAALAYAACGLRVLPLHTPLPDGTCSCHRPCGRAGKHPRCRNWPQQAAVDLGQIESWWRRWPDANVGIATGGSLVVLDVDGPEGQQSLEELMAAYGPLPATAASRTGGGGRHYLFRAEPSRRVPSGVGRGTGLDVRGAAGQIVVPPSRHVSGLFYEWERPPADGIAPIPGWLLDWMTEGATAPRQPQEGPSAPRRRAQESPDGLLPNWTPSTSFAGLEAPPEPGLPSALLQEMIRRFPIDGVGCRNERTYHAVASLIGRGYDPDLTYSVLSAWLEHHRDRMRTELPAARSLLIASIRSALKSPHLEPARSYVDHAALCRQLVLSPLQRRFLDSHIVPGRPSNADYSCELAGQWVSLLLPAECPALPPADDRWKQQHTHCHPPLMESGSGSGSASACHPLLMEGDRGTTDNHMFLRLLEEVKALLAKGDATAGTTGVLRNCAPPCGPNESRLCRTHTDRAFVEAVLAHAVYKTRHLHEEAVQATNQQLKELMAARSNVVVDNKQFARLKAKFITRPGQPAQRLELLRETRKGTRSADGGIPSEYALSALQWLFSLEAME